MATEPERLRYCIRCDKAGPGSLRLIDSRLVDDGVVLPEHDDEIEIWVHYDCLGMHRAKILADGLGAFARHKAQEERAKQNPRVDHVRLLTELGEAAAHVAETVEEGKRR